ncbi:50S ribosomal protein L30 [Corynebacterium renale]|uniref:50S ribosomal protein L30 n=1 Tax=Corynebacterium renale TaxID=1724 RepID=UPI0006530DE1|nr:50S ribosomal protein L30 [Corynebacterium renale]
MALKITQVRGLVGTKPSQRKNIEALGLKRIHRSVIKPDNAAVRGQIQMVAHLVTVEEVAGE